MGSGPAEHTSPLITSGGDEPGQPWTATTHSVSQLREFEIDPSPDRIKRAVELIGANARWEHDSQPYWEDEVEPCINGVTVANGTYFGVAMVPIVDRLVGERLDDGGWNCEAENGPPGYASSMSHRRREYLVRPAAGPAIGCSMRPECPDADWQWSRPPW